MAIFTSDELRKIVREEFADKRKLPELIFGIGVHSKAKVSLWLNKKYKGDTKRLERDIASFLSRRGLSRADERRLSQVREILNDADNPQSIIAFITASSL